ncbi:MAG: alkaline phosphatase family protein [Polyangiaceae bacterium]|nr:alkaline phosphatase family protein [Polyangiaceae bacterium]
MKRRVLFVFIDAFGPRQQERFGARLAQFKYRRSLKGVLGYTSGALPAILTGTAPCIHGRACLFSCAATQDSLLSPLGWLGLLPSVIHEQPRLRQWASQWLKKKRGFTGYLDLHKVPPDLFKYFDLPEKEDLFYAKEIGGQPTFLQQARAAGLSVFAAPWQLPEKERWRKVHEELAHTAPDLTFLYAAELDRVLHAEGNRGSQAEQVIADISANIERAQECLQSKPGELLTIIVGDHGMSDVLAHVDPTTVTQHFQPGSVFVDATMIRFYGTPQDIDLSEKLIADASWPGTFLREEGLRAAEFPTTGSPFGKAIFVLDEGVSFSPSFLGKAPQGMHGYTSEFESHAAAISADAPLPEGLHSLTDLSGWVLDSLNLESAKGRKSPENDKALVPSAYASKKSVYEIPHLGMQKSQSLRTDI